MSAPHASEIVEGYLARVEVALRDAEPEVRRELLADVRAHIAAAREGLADETDAELFAILSRLGAPDVLAEGSRERALPPAAAAAHRWGLLEAGAVVLTFFAWPAGVLLAWLSGAWTDREKLVATLIGAFSFAIGFPLFAPLIGPVLGPFVGSLGGAAPIFMGAIGALPLASAVYLATRLRGRPAAPFIAMA